MPIACAQITVSTEPTQLITRPDLDVASICIKSEDRIYLGNGGVSIDDGFLLNSDEILVVGLGLGEQISAIVEDGETIVYILMTLNL